VWGRKGLQVPFSFVITTVVVHFPIVTTHTEREPREEMPTLRDHQVPRHHLHHLHILLRSLRELSRTLDSTLTTLDHRMLDTVLTPPVVPKVRAVQYLRCLQRLFNLQCESLLRYHKRREEW